MMLNLSIYTSRDLFWFVVLILSFRTADNLSRVALSSITRVCHTVRPTIMPSVVPSVLDVQSQSLDAVSRLCSGNSIQNILFVHFAWSNSTRAPSRNRMTSPIAIRASTNYLAKIPNNLNLRPHPPPPTSQLTENF